MAKAKMDVMPLECCGVCGHSMMEESQLICYGSPPYVVPDENGEPYCMRGAVVEPEDRICALFKPRMHS